MPSALERFDSKYMARIRHSFSLSCAMPKLMPRKLHPPSREAASASATVLRSSWDSLAIVWLRSDAFEAIQTENAATGLRPACSARLTKRESPSRAGRAEWTAALSCPARQERGPDFPAPPCQRHGPAD